MAKNGIAQSASFKVRALRSGIGATGFALHRDGPVTNIWETIASSSMQLEWGSAATLNVAKCFLEGKILLVTSAPRGIGATTAMKLAIRGRTWC